MVKRLKPVVACFVLAIAVAAASPCSAQNKPGVHADLTYATKYMSHGWNIGDNKPFYQPSVTVDAGLPGLQFAVWSAFPTDRDLNELDEVDYMVKYNHTFLPNTVQEVNLHMYVDYWTCPHSRLTKDMDGQDIAETEKRGMKYHAGVSFPKYIPFETSFLVPSFNVYHWEPGQKDLFESGSVYEFFLSYSTHLSGFAPRKGKEPPLVLGSSINYNDGAFGAKDGWSHATVHMSTTFPMLGLSVTPSVNYQWSFEDSVDTENEFWATISASIDL